MRGIIIICVIALLVLASGCVKQQDSSSISIPGEQQTEDDITPAKQAEYKIASLIDYDKTKCGDIAFSPVSTGSFNSGLHVAMKDALTGENLQGQIYVAAIDFGFGGYGEKYRCIEGLNSTYAVISANSAGYTPAAFEFEFHKNKLVDVEVPMLKSCTGGQSLLDNIKLIAKTTKDQNKMIRELQEKFYSTIEREFGMNRKDYTLNCKEADFDRGGFIKATGTYKNNIPFELYYHWGWCTSGGSDCGWSACLSAAPSELYDSVKKDFCSKLTSYNTTPDRSEPGITRFIRVHDTTNQTRIDCFEGKFEKIDGTRRTISVDQRSSTGFELGGAGKSLNCLEN